MKKIENIWLELENTNGPGFSYKRYSPAVMPDLFVGLHPSQNNRCLAILVKKTNIPDLYQWSHLKDFRVEILPDKDRKDNAFILIELRNEQFANIFSVLCEDLIFKVFNTVDENKLIHAIICRFEKWRIIFEKIASKGLTEIAQRELYGKLYFLRELLKKGIPPLRCIEAWVGPTDAAQDFQYKDWAVEVTTNQGYEDQQIQIKSERTLDDTLVPNIYLMHLLFEVRVNYGETLLDMVHSILELLSNELIALNKFKLLMHEAGYFAIHTERYQEKGYAERDRSFYFIEDGFPSITKKQLIRGVADVKYAILTSECNKFCIDEYSFFQNLKF